MYLKKKPKYPVRKWLGKYSAHTAMLYKNVQAWESNEAAIERFLKSFPRYRSLEHFTATDFADYKALHPSTDARPVRQFWIWLKSQGLPLYQIALDSYRSPHKTNYNLDLNDMLRLLNECSSPELKRKIISAVKGESAHIPVRLVALNEELRNAASRVGLPANFRLCHLKARVNKRLRQDLIESYCQKLLDTLSVEPKTTSDTFAAIEASSSNVWPSIGDSYHHLPTSIRVIQQ